MDTCYKFLNTIVTYSGMNKTFKFRAEYNAMQVLVINRFDNNIYNKIKSIRRTRLATRVEKGRHHHSLILMLKSDLTRISRVC